MAQGVYSVFICYRWAHRAFADDVYSALAEAGCHPVLDDVMVTSTIPHDSQSAAHIQDDDCVVVILPPDFPSWLPNKLSVLQQSLKKKEKKEKPPELAKEIRLVYDRAINDPGDPVVLIVMQDANRTPNPDRLPQYLTKFAGVIEGGSADWRTALKDRIAYLRRAADDAERQVPDLQGLRAELANLATEWRYGRSGGNMSAVSDRPLPPTRNVGDLEYQPPYYVALQGTALRSAGEPGDQAVATATDAIEWILRGTCRHSWVVGDAGSGKTIAMTRAASVAADEWIEWSRRQEAPDAAGPSPRVPIFLTCAGFYPSAKGKEADPWRGITAKSLAKRMARPTGRSFRSFMAQLGNQSCLLLLDGLDEVPDPRAAERITQTIEFLDSSAADLKVVVSTRADDLRLSPATAHVMRLQPFGFDRGTELVKKIAGASGSLGARVMQVEKLLQEKRTSRQFETLTNPLLITIACLLAKEAFAGPLQTRLGELLDRVLSRLSPSGDREIVGRPALQALALEAMRRVEDRLPLPSVVDVLNAAVPGAGMTLDSVARQFVRVSGIVRIVPASDNNDFIHFRHPYFLNYLAAEAVADWPIENLFTRLRSEIKGWRRVAEFLPGLFARRAALDKACQFLAQLASEARTVTAETPALWLAGLRAVVDNRDLQQSAEARNFTLAARKAVDEADGSWSEHSRAEVLDACGLAAQPYYLGEIFRRDWIEVPELSSGRISISNAPVTVAEYARFLNDPYRKDEKLWKFESEMNSAQPRFVDEADEGSWQEQLKTPLRPVTHVTWYEAMAYCAWLTENDGLSGIVRLPRPTEWRVIARPDNAACDYPWGGGAARFNSRDVGLQRLSPVGLFPAYCRPGLLDFGTNVYEWSQGTGNARPDEAEVLGGTWADFTDHLRIDRKAIFRKRAYRRPDTSFRCLLERAV